MMGNFQGRKLSQIGSHLPNFSPQNLHVGHTIQWETFEGENFCGSVRATISWRNFHGMLKPNIGGYGIPKFSWRKLVDGSQTAKFVKVFSVESFLLYSVKPAYNMTLSVFHEMLFFPIRESFSLQKFPLSYCTVQLKLYLLDKNISQPSYPCII